jgi:hypothetical protein
MSKRNKVNKDAYTQRGRLTPDQMARERMRQSEISSHAKGKENMIGKVRGRSDEPASSRPRSSPEAEE